MSKGLKLEQKLFNEKVGRLEAAKLQLKNEFFGIDHIIDEIIELVSSWYFFPMVQDKALVINLWGLTGVGKTALVRRLAQLLDFSEKFYSIDLGGKKYRNESIQEKLEEIYEYDNGVPVIISLDEFQYARTLSRDGEEMNNEYSRIIWELLDSGSFQTRRAYHFTEELYELLSKLRYLKKHRNLKVENGFVMNHKEFFLKVMKSTFLDFLIKNEDDFDAEDLLLIPHDTRENIYDAVKAEFDSFEDFRTFLDSLTLAGTIDYVNSVISFAQSPKIVDCRKALVFVLGNLDEAYSMSGDFNPDISADEFHERSLKINITTVKNALSLRFRSEQVARLGNTHIIYPALNRDSYIQIIDRELLKTGQKYREFIGADCEFDESVRDLIYREGVFPTMGTRPVFTSIHQIIASQFGNILVSLTKQDLEADKIRFSFQDREIQVQFIQKNSVKGSYTYQPVLRMKKLRENTSDDRQAVVAVHESGHAVMSMALFDLIPECVYSVLSDSSIGQGVTAVKMGRDFITKKEILHRTALLLGGFAAEKLIFGEDCITDGSENDISQATQFLSHLLKNTGFGDIPAAYHTKDMQTNDFIHDEGNEFKKAVESRIQESLTLAEETVLEFKPLLLKLAEYLSSHPKIEKEEIRLMLEDFPELQSKKSTILAPNYFMKRLKEELQSLQKPDDASQQVSSEYSQSAYKAKAE